MGVIKIWKVDLFVKGGKRKRRVAKSAEDRVSIVAAAGDARYGGEEMSLCGVNSV